MANDCNIVQICIFGVRYGSYNSVIKRIGMSIISFGPAIPRKLDIWLW